MSEVYNDPNNQDTLILDTKQAYYEAFAENDWRDVQLEVAKMDDTLQQQGRPLFAVDNEGNPRVSTIPPTQVPVDKFNVTPIDWFSSSTTGYGVLVFAGQSMQMRPRVGMGNDDTSTELPLRRRSPEHRAEQRSRTTLAAVAIKSLFSKRHGQIEVA